MNNEPLLWLNDSRGIYIPRDFAASFVDRDKHVSGVSAENWAILDAGPDHEWYWDAWTEVCDDARIAGDDGVEYFVYQDGDCWLVPKGMEWDDRNDFWAWPQDEDEDDTETESTP